MNCNLNKEELLAYLEGESSQESHNKIKSHLVSCTECQRELTTLKQTDAIFRKVLKNKKLSPDFLSRVKNRIPCTTGDAWRGSREPKMVHRPTKSPIRHLILRWAPLAAAATILITLGLIFLRKGPEEIQPPEPQPTAVQEFTLTDGSQIIASPGAEITIKDRSVTLKKGGELYVKVTPDTKRFQLITPAGTVLVHGTEFLVKVYHNEMPRHSSGSTSQSVADAPTGSTRGENMKIGKWIISVMILTGMVQLTTPMGDIMGTGGEALYAEEGSAPKKQVEDLALRFAKYYEKVETKVKPEIPAYQLPLETDKLANPEVLKKIGGVDETLLKKNGFVVKKWRGDDMVEAYKNLKEREVPIFITTDSLLHLYHIQFDETLREIEEREFYKDICAISEAMRKEAMAAYKAYDDPELKEAARRNVAYFTVGLKVLDPETEIPAYVKQEVETELANIERHEGFADSAVFTYKEDYSQYVPRGHYTRSETLKKYFKGLMWYGRLTFIAKGGEPHGQFAPYLVSVEEAKIQTLAGSMDATWLDEVKLPDNRTCKDAWERIYAVTSFYVGLADDLTPDEYKNGLITALGKNYKISALKDNEKFFGFKVEIAKMRCPTIYSGTGESGTMAIKALMGEPSPEELDKVLEKTKGFRFMGQRFIPDSYFMGKMVFPTIGKPKSKGMFTEAGGMRIFPRGLDVMAILGSNRALQILHDLKDDNYKGYYETLEKLQTEIDEVKSGHNWNRNIYWGWLYALRSLLKEDWKGYQTFMTTTAYQDKNLNTVLGSWSQLRHDTILYAKQSYTMSKGRPPQPKPVQGYVEPVPEFYARLLGLARMTNKGLSEMKVLSKEAKGKLVAFVKIVERLLTISEKELKNKELTEEEYQFIRNFATQLEKVCVKKESHYDRKKYATITSGAETRTTLIADVHTDINTKQVLEEGTGEIELMVVAYKQPDGRIVLGAGPVFSYYEFKHPMSDRLTDEAWRETLKKNPPPRPEWTGSFRQK